MNKQLDKDVKIWSCSSMVGRDEAVNFLVTGTLSLFNGKNEASKSKNTVPIVIQGRGGSLMFLGCLSPNVFRIFAKINGIKKLDQ